MSFESLLKVVHENEADKKQAITELNKAWFEENKLLAKHHQSQHKLRSTITRKVKRIKINNCIEYLYFEQISARNESHMIKFWKNTRKYMKMLHEINKLHQEILSCFYQVTSSKALDFHFLLSQFTFITSLNETFKNYCIQNPNDFNEFYNKNMTETIKEASGKLKEWKNAMTPVVKANPYAVICKRKWNLNWKINKDKLKKQKQPRLTRRIRRLI